MRQAYLLCGSSIVLMSLSLAADFILGYNNIINIIPFWLLIWIGILLYVIIKYRFIPITTGMVSKDITENIEEGIILLDPELNIIHRNEALLRLVHADGNRILRLQDIFFEKHVLRGELSMLAETGGTSFSTRINVVPHGTDNKLPVDLKVKKIIDRYNDISGFLIIVSRVKNLDQLKSIFGITTRELEVIRQLLIGKSNRDIAGILGVTVKTIETHIASIYNKLMIKNRIELLHLLSRYDSPEPPGPFIEESSQSKAVSSPL